MESLTRNYSDTWMLHSKGLMLLVSFLWETCSIKSVPARASLWLSLSGASLPRVMPLPEASSAWAFFVFFWDLVNQVIFLPVSKQSRNGFPKRKDLLPQE